MSGWQAGAWCDGTGHLDDTSSCGDGAISQRWKQKRNTTRCGSMAYRPFRSEEYSPGGVRKVTSGTVACDRQVFAATLLFDPSMSALPIMKTPKSQSAGLLTQEW